MSLGFDKSPWTATSRCLPDTTPLHCCKHLGHSHLGLKAPLSGPKPIDDLYCFAHAAPISLHPRLALGLISARTHGPCGEDQTEGTTHLRLPLSESNTSRLHTRSKHVLAEVWDSCDFMNIACSTVRLGESLNLESSILPVGHTADATPVAACHRACQAAKRFI